MEEAQEQIRRELMYEVLSLEGKIESQKEDAKLLSEEIQKIQKEIFSLETQNKIISEQHKRNEFGFAEATIDVALSSYNKEEKHYIFSVEVGGSGCLFLSNKKPTDAIEEILETAKNGQEEQVYIRLRQYGFVHSLTELAVAENEILGLINFQILYEKIKPELGCFPPFYSQNFKLIELENSNSETVFGVRVNKLQDELREISENEEEIKSKREAQITLEEKLTITKNNLVLLKEQQLRENDEAEFEKRYQNWFHEVEAVTTIRLGFFRYEVKRNPSLLLLGLGGYIELKHPVFLPNEVKTGLINPSWNEIQNAEKAGSWVKRDDFSFFHSLGKRTTFTNDENALNDRFHAIRNLDDYLRGDDIEERIQSFNENSIDIQKALSRAIKELEAEDEIIQSAVQKYLHSRIPNFVSGAKQKISAREARRDKIYKTTFHDTNTALLKMFRQVNLPTDSVGIFLNWLTHENVQRPYQKRNRSI